jgi:hypothetical protein
VHGGHRIDETNMGVSYVRVLQVPIASLMGSDLAGRASSVQDAQKRVAKLSYGRVLVGHCLWKDLAGMSVAKFVRPSG